MLLQWNKNNAEVNIFRPIQANDISTTWTNEHKIGCDLVRRNLIKHKARKPVSSIQVKGIGKKQSKVWWNNQEDTGFYKQADERMY